MQFGVALTLLVAIGWITYMSAAGAVQNARLVIRTFEILRAVDAVVEATVTGEAASRGYVITGRESFLQPFQDARTQVPLTMTRLRELITPDPSRRQLVRDLDSLVAIKLAFIAEAVEVRRTEGAAAAEKLVETERGKRAMDNIRRIARAIESDQLMLLQRQTERLETTGQRLLWMGLAGTVVAVIVVTLALVAITRDLARRERADQLLRERERAVRRSEDDVLRWMVERHQPPRAP